MYGNYLNVGRRSSTWREWYATDIWVSSFHSSDFASVRNIIAKSQTDEC